MIEPCVTFGDVKVWVNAIPHASEKVFEIAATDLTLEDARWLARDLITAVEHVEAERHKRGFSRADVKELTEAK